MNYALITIDTEGPLGNNPVDNLIWGKTDQGYFGIDYIMDICDSFNTKALFFVDFAEVWSFGEEAINDVVSRIDSRGHEVGVHIHPDHMGDSSRKFLWQYSKVEQQKIITLCSEKYKKMIGKDPLYFRAGKYSANNDTLEIIASLGYKYDLSEFYGKQWCGIDPPITADMPCRYGRLVEIPVSAFRSVHLFGVNHIDKLDLEMVSAEFKYVVNKYKKFDSCILIVFLHSFSLLEWRKRPDSPIPSYPAINKVRTGIEYVSKCPDIELLDPGSCHTLIEAKKIKIADRGNSKPRVSINNPIAALAFAIATAWRIKGYKNKKAKALLTCTVIAAIVVIVITLLLLNSLLGR